MIIHPIFREPEGRALRNIIVRIFRRCHQKRVHKVDLSLYALELSELLLAGSDGGWDAHRPPERKHVQRGNGSVLNLDHAVFPCVLRVLRIGGSSDVDRAFLASIVGAAVPANMKSAGQTGDLRWKHRELEAPGNKMVDGDSPRP